MKYCRIVRTLLGYFDIYPSVFLINKVAVLSLTIANIQCFALKVFIEYQYKAVFS